MARPRAKIDLIELEKLYGLQCTDKEAAPFLGISVRTLERRRKEKKFGEAADAAKAKDRVSSARSCSAARPGENIAAIVFLAKNLLGYRDVFNTEHSGLDGASSGTVTRSHAPEFLAKRSIVYLESEGP